MSTLATRQIVITFEGDVDGTQVAEAAPNPVSPAAISMISLSDGDNEITISEPTGVTVRGVTIIPPAGNTTPMVLKGLDTDSGIDLHLTDPSSISLAAGVTAFFLEATGEDIEGVRLIWT